MFGCTLTRTYEESKEKNNVSKLRKNGTTTIQKLAGSPTEFKTLLMIESCLTGKMPLGVAKYMLVDMGIISGELLDEEVNDNDPVGAIKECFDSLMEALEGISEDDLPTIFNEVTKVIKDKKSSCKLLTSDGTDAKKETFISKILEGVKRNYVTDKSEMTTVSEYLRETVEDDFFNLNIQNAMKKVVGDCALKKKSANNTTSVK